ncbi:YhgE/Pip domain-containing protein [Virgibacillus sp. W0181]|uniref:YhgE/Pip domain-containing protein n=1 Tax=Virgibacillus sp. W0181 TaxID=3391581 RepID=UPI003F47F70D
MLRKHINYKFVVMLSCIFLIASMPLHVLADETNGTDEESNQKAGNSVDGEYDSKDEVIYGKLDASGETDEMYVVNTFHVTKAGKLVDYGNYTNIRNLTDLTDITMPSNNKVAFEATESEFYYQGELENKALPWDISIRYLLDGKEIQPESLAGKSGEVEIHIQTRKNDEVDPVFFNYYMQQVSVTLDPSKFSDIVAPKGIKANEGKNQQITFSILPEEEENFIITADVTEFELQPIQINALPANIAIDDPDFSSMTSEFKSLADAIAQLHSGTAQLNNGISDLNAGVSELSSGSTEYRNGINELNQQSDALVNGSGEIKKALGQINQALNAGTETPDLSEIKQLPKGLHELASGLREASQGIKQLKGNYEQAYGHLAKAIQAIPDVELSDADIKALKESDLDEETVNQLIELSKTAKNVKKTFAEVQKAFDAIPATLDEIMKNLKTTADEVDTTAEEVKKGLQDFDPEQQIEQLQNGIAALNKEYNGFHSGVVAYTEGVGSLATSYRKLDNGIQSLSGNIPSLDRGASELEEGVKELKDETKDLPGEVESEIEEALEEFDYSDFKPVSFVSEKNKKIEVVQFVLQTDSIEMPEEEDENTDEKVEKKGVWQRFLDLFGL